MPGLIRRPSTVALVLLVVVAAMAGVAPPPEAVAITAQPGNQNGMEPDVELTDRPLAGDISPDELWVQPGDRLGSADVATAGDIVSPPVPLASQFAAEGTEFTGDPLRLAVYPLETRRYSVGTDRIGVYLCTWGGADGDVDLDEVTNTLNGAVGDYLIEISGGRYNPVFTARAEVKLPANRANHFTCAEEVMESTSHGDNGALAVMDNDSNGGLATSGDYCLLPCADSTSPDTFPTNRRWGVVDGGSLTSPDQVAPFENPHLTTAVHEIGHMLGWPHSNSGTNDAVNPEYDNPIDVMSGNLSADASGAPDNIRADDPYATAAWNRYRAGWIDPGQVLVYEGGIVTVELAPVGRPGTQMVVLPSTNPYSFLTLDARRSLGADAALPDSFGGVTGHYVEQLGDCGPITGVAVCWGLESSIHTYPPAPDNLRHVTTVDGSQTMDVARGAPLVAKGTKMTVLSGDDSGYTIRLVGFSDTASSVFLDDIIWLAEEGVTKGCNPPANDEFCPTDSVTRAQMAAFLVRALDLPQTSDQGFTDTADSTFKADIDALAAAGITKGCNPPANDEFCPTDPVTRGQMAAFIKRGAAHPPS